MPHSRHVDLHGVLITKLTGVVTLNDLLELQNELHRYVCDEEVYELVVHQEDMEILQTSQESSASAENVHNVLKGLKKAAIAFVSNSDLVYGLCRQLQIRVENEHIQLCVFRTEETALKWLHEIKLSNKADTVDG